MGQREKQTFASETACVKVTHTRGGALRGRRRSSLAAVYLALVGLDLLSAEQLPPEGLQLLCPVLARLSVRAHDAGAQLI